MALHNTETEVMSLTKELTGDALVNWSDEKRKEFVNTFESRVKAAQYILRKTAVTVWGKAFTRQFVSEKHRTAEIGNLSLGPYDNPSGHWNRPNMVGGRAVSELDEIAQERADNVLASLPQLKVAVKYINPELSKMIERKEALVEQGRALLLEANELSGSIDMDDFPEETTLASFKAHVKEREKKRQRLVDKMDEIGEEGQSLSKKINKALYSGLPGLSEAVVNVITELLERASALSALLRRVSEQVQFGDSEAALTILSGFEKDELTVSDDIKAQFDKAISALKKAGGKKPAKALKKGE